MNEFQRTFYASIKPYHVFINHRGPDARNSLASIIYHSLHEKGLNVFFDTTEFEPGQELLTTIREAIRTSSVHIAILSPRYAESPWCLDELCEMQKSGAKILPVFYNVPPGDLMRLRKGEGAYADALKDLENKEDGGIRRYDSCRLNEWREALKNMCNISGLELGSTIYNGDQGMLLKDICRQVMEHVRIERKKSIDGLLGLDQAVDDFKDFLLLHGEQSEKVKIVGIVGTPGSGKTTLAEEYFYRHRNSFNGSSLLLGVRKASKRNGLTTLQRQLLKDLASDPSVVINNVSEGKDIFADRVGRLCHGKSFKFLIVIDDIDRQDQLDALLFNEGVLRSESLIIVTSRDKAILKLSGIQLHYETKPLRLDDARELLCRSAFLQFEPNSGFEDLIQTAMSKCGGLPKFLKIIGGNLHLYGNNDKEHWEDELHMISGIPDILKTTYAALEDEEKEVFLDIACFFEGMEKNSAMRIWDGSGWRGARALRKLEYMCLIQFDHNNCLKMNDCVSNLGREIADRQLHNCSHLPCRLWRRNHSRSFLPNKEQIQEHSKIRGIANASKNYQRLYEGKNPKACRLSSSLQIELLQVIGDIAYASYCDGLRNLVWFRWKNCPETSVPPSEMANLRVLEVVNGSVETLWTSDSQLPEQLREISVIECTRLVKIPPTIGFLKHLEKMTLDCTISLKRLPHEFCQLQALKHLVLRQCERLRSLPNGFGQLINLQHILT